MLRPHRQHDDEPSSAAGECERDAPASALNEVDPDAARREVYRALRSAHALVGAGDAARTLRSDLGRTRLGEDLGAPHLADRPEPTGRSQQTVAAAPRRTGTEPRGERFAFVLASLGAAAVGLGVGLGAWSLAGVRAELWNPALAATLGGQGLLIIGLVQLLASVGNASRAAGAKLSQMHDELRRVRRAAEEQTGRGGASAAAFYADLAREAPNEVLVGNLRGQLDLLAARLR